MSVADVAMKLKDGQIRYNDLRSKSEALIAPKFVQATANDPGSFVVYTDGKVYYLENGHTAGTTWANTTKVETNIAAELKAQKADFQQLFVSEPLVNIYTPQSIDSIMTGYILRNGVPQTQYGSGYYVTDYIPVNGGDTINLSFKPWNAADDIFRGAIYTEEKTYISIFADTTFTLPSNAAYIRFSVHRGSFGDTFQSALDYINANMVISNGDVVNYTGIDKTKNAFQSVNLARKECTYFVDASGKELLILSKMQGCNNKDVGLKMKNFIQNDSFQFCSFGTIDNNSPFVSNKPSEYVEFMSTGEDFFGPIVAFVENNIDGDDPNNGHFTGGMHKFNSQNTTRLISIDIYYDGRKVPGFFGYCNTIDIIIKQNLQVSNTLKNALSIPRFAGAYESPDRVINSTGFPAVRSYPEAISGVFL